MHQYYRQNKNVGLHYEMIISPERQKSIARSLQGNDDPDRFRKGRHGCPVICPGCGVYYCCLPAKQPHTDHRCDKCD